MITETELNQLKEFCKGNAELSAILRRTDYLPEGCFTCIQRKDRMCQAHDGEIPADFEGPCDQWDYIPF